METITFESAGFVLGYYWGGGKGCYPARHLFADSKDELIEKANAALYDDSLDNGMGYESLIGALLMITEITTIDINGKEFSSAVIEEVFIGSLTEDEQDFLTESSY